MKQSWNNIYETIGESRAFSHSDDTEQQEQQVHENPLFSTRNSSAERWIKILR